MATNKKSKNMSMTLDDIVNDVYNESNQIESRTDTDIEINNEPIANVTIDKNALSELQDIVNKAVPVKTELLVENTNEMNEIKNDFAGLIANKVGKKDERKELKKYYSKVFKTIKDYLYFQGGYPKENSKGKGEKLAELLTIIVPWLQYIGEWSIVEKHLLESGISISNTIPLENRNSFEFLKDSGMKNTIKDFFNESKDTQDKICQNTDSLIKDYYENLPEDIRYDKHENPTGLKPAQFNKLVSIVAKKQIDSEKGEELQDKAVYQLECLTESTKLLKNSIIESN